MSETLYKVLTSDGKSCHGGNSVWNLPNGDTPGDWMPEIDGELVTCKNGYHLCREKDLLTWLNEAIFEAEYEGELVEADDKVVVRKVRLVRRLNWDERTARLFACDCAERVLHFYEEEYPDEKRPRMTIETARRYANGEANKAELSAAWDAARDAAWDAARAAAWAAARAAAWAAAWDAAWDAARDAEKKWQIQRLMEYLRGEP